MFRNSGYFSIASPPYLVVKSLCCAQYLVKSLNCFAFWNLIYRKLYKIFYKRFAFYFHCSAKPCHVWTKENHETIMDDLALLNNENKKQLILYVNKSYKMRIFYKTSALHYKKARKLKKNRNYRLKFNILHINW